MFVCLFVCSQTKGHILHMGPEIYKEPSNFLTLEVQQDAHSDWEKYFQGSAQFEELECRERELV
uniref:Uncharacterized protein n=1 Tax=Anguilla anguilla TaxID=7936 RepID=A0A0E9SCV5_ANGAN